MAANSAAIERAMQRRSIKAPADVVRIQWFIKEVSNKVAMPMRDRVRIATEYVKSKIVRNISRPVMKMKGVRSGRIVVTDRSKPGEFPKADTTMLMKTIFSVLAEPSPGIFDGYVGTPLDYGAILETSGRLNRSFLVRTLNEERSKIMAILTGPIK